MKMFVERIQTLTIIHPQHVYCAEAVSCDVYYQNKDSTAGIAKCECQWPERSQAHHSSERAVI